MRCPDCGQEMVKVSKGWCCPSPRCPVITVCSTGHRRGYGYKETRVTREARALNFSENPVLCVQKPPREPPLQIDKDGPHKS